MKNETKYNAVAVTLHWVMALAFLGMIASGLILEQEGLLPRDKIFELYQIHKSVGLTLLVTFFLRIGWRLWHKSPALPESLKGLEKLAAKAGHWALYFFMLAMPITGWLLVSSSPYGLPTLYFGTFEWPHIPGVAGDEAVNGASREAHEILAYIFIGVIAVHILAVIKHWIIDKHNLLPRMWFSLMLAALLTMPTSAFANSYIVDTTKSMIGFSGEHAGKEFTGVFEDWSADIWFDKDDLLSSSAVITIQTASAKTSDKLYDGTLPNDDWFDVSDYPEAVFKSSSFTHLQGDAYEVSGILTIKEKDTPVTFSFTLTEGIQAVEAKAEFTLDRLELNIGTRSDPKAEWVSQMIGISLYIAASY